MNENQRKEAEQKFLEFQNQDINNSDIEKATEKAGNLKEQMDNFMLMISMVKDSWNGKFQINKMDMAIIVGAILYVVSPIDAIPDFIPVVGWMDDIAIVGLAMSKLSGIISEYKAFRNTIEI